MTVYATKRDSPTNQRSDWNSFWATCPQCQHRYGISVKLITAYLDRLFSGFTSRGAKYLAKAKQEKPASVADAQSDRG